jgi:hypothetical protein
MHPDDIVERGCAVEVVDDGQRWVVVVVTVIQT